MTKVRRKQRWRNFVPLVVAGAALLSYRVGLTQQGPVRASSPIRFEYRPIPFVLQNSETPQKHQPEILPGGVALFDYDNDGYLDVYFTNGAELPGLKKTSPRYWNRLFRNNGRGGFEDVTGKAGVMGSGYDMGVAVGDYDNDGYQDLFVAGVHGNTLYHNNGDGTFTDVTSQAGLNRPDGRYGPLWGIAAAWLDYDNDGRLDLFVSNYCLWNPKTERGCLVDGKPDYCHPRNYPGQPNSLFHNNGDGTFTDVSESSGIRAHVGKGMGVAVADYDLDGRLDIFVANDKFFNFLFHNEGNGKFTESAFEAGVAVPQDGNPVSGMGADFRDINNDGLPDIFFTALQDETFPLFLNVGRGLFEEATYSSRLTFTYRMAGWGAGIFDLDNDGWKDIFVARSDALSPSGGRGPRVKEPNSVFRNLGGAVMADLTEAAGLLLRKPQMYRGAAFGDLNNDGRIDVVVSALAAEAEIWQNTSPGHNHWLELKLTGRASNRDAIGARIKVVSKRGAQFNHVTHSVGYASSSAGPVHFGLGPDAQAELVEIVWPSGKVQQLRNVAVDRVTKIIEP